MRSNQSPADEFFASFFSSQLPQGFADFREASDRFQKSAISLGAGEAGILQFLVGLHGKPKWIEIGTLTGFSGFCIVKALPSNGHLWTFEKEPKYAAQARELFQQKQISDRVTVVEGDASQTLEQVKSHGPFDGLFIDGNKGAYATNLDWAEQNLAPGALIIADNVFLGGALWEGPTDQTPWSASVIQKMRDFIARLMNPENYQTALLPTTEGLLVARKRS